MCLHPTIYLPTSSFLVTRFGVDVGEAVCKIFRKISAPQSKPTPLHPQQCWEGRLAEVDDSGTTTTLPSRSKPTNVAPADADGAPDASSDHESSDIICVATQTHHIPSPSIVPPKPQPLPPHHVPAHLPHLALFPPSGAVGQRALGVNPPPVRILPGVGVGAVPNTHVVGHVVPSVGVSMPTVHPRKATYVTPSAAHVTPLVAHVPTPTVALATA